VTARVAHTHAESDLLQQSLWLHR